jgi:hypothetical protein
MEINVRSTTPNGGTKAIPAFRLDDLRSASVRPNAAGLLNRRKVNPTNGSHSFHISNDAHIDGVVQTIEAIGAFARDHGPGRYVVNEHYPDPLQDSFNSSKVWGEVIHHLDGKIAIRIAPTPDPR